VIAGLLVSAFSFGGVVRESDKSDPYLAPVIAPTGFKPGVRGFKWMRKIAN
jgi:hypothetical protein